MYAFKNCIPFKCEHPECVLSKYVSWKYVYFHIAFLRHLHVSCTIGPVRCTLDHQSARYAISLLFAVDGLHLQNNYRV